jgi:hypothetical protein
MIPAQQAATFPINRSTRNRLLQFALIAFAGVIIAALLGGCGSDERRKPYDAASNGKTITLHRGEPFHLRMIVNITIGANWQIVELDRSVVDMRGKPMPRGDVVVGGLPRIYNYDYMFQTIRNGTTKLKMNLVKPGVEEPLDKFEVTLVVQD